MALRHALALQAQHVKDVGAFEHVVEPIRHLDRPVRHVGRQQCGRRHEHHARTEHAERRDIAARHTAVHDVADDREREAVESFFAQRLAHREAVDERLRRMLMPAVAGVHHARIGPFADLPRNTRRLVPHDESVDAHVADRLYGVAQALAFVHAGCRHAEGHCVGRQTLGRSLERKSRARGVFEEQAHHGAAPQRRHLGHRSAVDLDHVVGQVEQAHETVVAEFIDAAQVLHHRGLPSTVTPSAVARTSSSMCVGRFFPT